MEPAFFSARTPILSRFIDKIGFFRICSLNHLNNLMKNEIFLENFPKYQEMGGGKSPEFATLPPFATPDNPYFESGGGKVAKWQTKIEGLLSLHLLLLFATLPLCHPHR